MSTPITETLNIIIEEFVPPAPIPAPTPESGEVSNIAVPNTGGIGNFIGHLGPMGCTIIIITLALLVSAVILLCCRKKFSNRHIPFLSSIGMFAFALGLSIPSFIFTTKAIEEMAGEHVTNFNISVAPDSITTSTINVEDFLAPTDYPFGYKITTYVDGDGTLTNTDDPSSIIIPTSPTTSIDPELLNTNSYGVKDFTTDTFIPISTDPDNPTPIYTTNENTPAGTSIPLTYAAKLDANFKLGNYTGSIHYDIEALPNPDPCAIYPDGSFDRVFCNVGKEKATAIDGNDYYQMQDMTSAICNTVQNATSTLATDTQIGNLVDIRDGKIYSVAKLADNACWMTSNLALELSATDTLDNTNTDLNSVTSWTPAHSTNESWTNDLYHPYSSLPDGAPDGAGVYYNWSAAVATNDTNTPEYTELYFLAPDSVCPKGWQLPVRSNDFTAINENQFAKLLVAYGWNSSTRIMPDTTILPNTPLKFIFSGMLYSNTLSNVGSSGYLWSPLNSSDEHAYSTNFTDSGSAFPLISIAYRYLGFPVRCLAR